MSKKLTAGQKMARAAIRAAMRDVVRQVDALDFRRNATEFRADFHLSCVQHQKNTGTLGGTVSLDYPVYTCRVASTR